MKKVFGWFVGVAVLGLALTGFASITGSAHDFSANAWSGGQICVVCHTPHNANTTVSGAPLWNHAVTAATFQVYTSPTLNAVVGQPAGVSKLCLSCHDGTVAPDSFGGRTGTAPMLTGDHLIGTDLRNDHPISFTYNTALATSDGGLFDPAVKDSGLGGTIAAKMLIGGSMECSSCHDVHNSPGTAAKLLVKSNSGSALCLTCHNK